jgi:hypothetical protein
MGIYKLFIINTIWQAKGVSFNYNKWQNNQAFSKHITCHYNSNKFIGCGECLARILKMKWV